METCQTGLMLQITQNCGPIEEKKKIYGSLEWIRVFGGNKKKLLDPVCVPRMLIPRSSGGIRGFWKGNCGSRRRSQDVIVRALKLDPEFVFSYAEKNHGGNAGSSQRSQDYITDRQKNQGTPE